MSEEIEGYRLADAIEKSAEDWYEYGKRVLAFDPEAIKAEDLYREVYWTLRKAAVCEKRLAAFFEGDCLTQTFDEMDRRHKDMVSGLESDFKELELFEHDGKDPGCRLTWHSLEAAHDEATALRRRAELAEAEAEHWRRVVEWYADPAQWEELVDDRGRETLRFRYGDDGGVVARRALSMWRANP